MISLARDTVKWVQDRMWNKRLYERKKRPMNTAKDEVKSLLEKLPDNCTIEDIQYHLYVIEKIRKGIERAEKEGTVSQEDVEKRFSRWPTK